jgi:hypothetical protein
MFNLKAICDRQQRQIGIRSENFRTKKHIFTHHILMWRMRVDCDDAAHSERDEIVAHLQLFMRTLTLFLRRARFFFFLSLYDRHLLWSWDWNKVEEVHNKAPN